MRVSCQSKRTIKMENNRGKCIINAAITVQRNKTTKISVRIFKCYSKTDDSRPIQWFNAFRQAPRTKYCNNKHHKCNNGGVKDKTATISIARDRKHLPLGELKTRKLILNSVYFQSTLLSKNLNYRKDIVLLTYSIKKL